MNRAPAPHPDAADSATAPVADQGGTPATPFHRMARLRPEWSARSKPLLTILATFMAYVVLASVLLVLTILALALAPGVNVAIGVTSGDPTSPLDVGLAVLMGALWLPSAMIGVRIGGWRPVGTAWSVTASLRRERLAPHLLSGIALGVLAVAAAAVAGAIVGLGPSASGGGSSPDAPASALQLLLVAVIVLVIAPIQAAGLELAMRGAVLQAVGTCTRSPLLPILLAALLVLIGRELTLPVVLPALALAVTAGTLAWKTGGLELPVALLATLTAGSLIVSSLAAGTGAGAGVAALSAAVAAPGTSAAALVVPGSAASAGGAAAAIVLLVLGALAVIMVSRREQLGILEPVTRPADEPAPEPIPH